MTSTFMKLGEKGNLSGAGMWAGLGMGKQTQQGRETAQEAENIHRSVETTG